MAKRVFFSFHYDDVIDFRANVVRNHRYVGGKGDPSYFDASLWEEAQRKNEQALKRLIHSGLHQTSVTAVLIGSMTYARPWVRYEIFKSFERGNALVGVHINSIPCKNGQRKPPGPNPFDNVGFLVDVAGRNATAVEWSNGGWQRFAHELEVAPNDLPFMRPGGLVQLSEFVPVYDWVAHNGYANFGRWVEDDE